ncbi:MAG: BCD family MFS transporter [Anaerolineae bacterium]
MQLFNTFRLGLLHVAVGITFVAINGVLNRIMIYELGILSTIVALLVILPYVLSPAQIWIGQYSDTHPIAGYRRSPYILLGMLLCIGGATLTPRAALLMDTAFWQGLGLGVIAFFLWGVGYNLAVVSYLSLASDLSPSDKRSRTISVMWFMMIASLIATAIIMGQALEPYSEAQLIQVFDYAGMIALGVALLGLVGLEPRHQDVAQQSRTSQTLAIKTVLGNPQARRFFIYLTLLLAAILGQDILLEPFAASTFNMTVEQTTQLTALWGSMTLLSLLLYGFVFSRFLTKKQGAYLGGVIATLGLIMIALSGTVGLALLFQPGIGVLGFGTGIATSSNLALMLDMTTPEQVGLFIGAWGVADALSRGLGMLMGGVVRDVVTALSSSVTYGYITVFAIEAMFLVVALTLLGQIDTQEFHGEQPSLVELTALVGDA